MRQGADCPESKGGTSIRGTKNNTHDSVDLSIALATSSDRDSSIGPPPRLRAYTNAAFIPVKRPQARSPRTGGPHTLSSIKNNVESFGI